VNKNRLTILLIALLTLLLVACDSPTTDPATTTEGDPTGYKFAAIFPGTITDADYNTLGYIGMTEVQNQLGVEVAFSENVAVPDVERVMREYIDNDFNIIFTHGGQFVSQTRALADEFPDVYFIAESDAREEGTPDNFWLIDRNFHVGFYAVGALAALRTETGNIAYISGLTLPFSYAEAHAIQQAIDDLGLGDEISYRAVWAGDFNDPSRARELADALIAENVDVLIGSLNLGMFGVFEAAKNTDREVYVIAKYTDKSAFAPDEYVTSLLYDFTDPLVNIVGRIIAGEPGDYYPLGFDTGVDLQFPLQNTPDEIDQQVREITEGLRSGEIEVIKNTNPFE
jgi:basic membrane protein A and related proteins